MTLSGGHKERTTASTRRTFLRSAGWTILLATLPLVAQRNNDIEYRLKAVYILNFIQFTEWPAAMFPNDSSAIVIGCMAENFFYRTLERTVANELVNKRRIEVRKITSPNDAKDCHVLFIGISERHRLKEMLRLAESRNILTIGEESDLSRAGSIIGFYLENNKIKFEINIPALKKTEIVLSSKLLRLARIVTSSEDEE